MWVKNTGGTSVTLSSYIFYLPAGVTGTFNYYGSGGNLLASGQTIQNATFVSVSSVIAPGATWISLELNVVASQAVSNGQLSFSVYGNQSNSPVQFSWYINAAASPTPPPTPAPTRAPTPSPTPSPTASQVPVVTTWATSFYGDTNPLVVRGGSVDAVIVTFSQTSLTKGVGKVNVPGLGDLTFSVSNNRITATPAGVQWPRGANSTVQVNYDCVRKNGKPNNYAVRNISSTS